MYQITTVTFDLWQTLLVDQPDLAQVRAQLRLEGAAEALLKVGQAHPLERIGEAYQACLQQCSRIRKQERDISFREQVEIFINHISPGLAARLDEKTIQEVSDAYADSFYVHPPAPHPDAAAVLQGVKEMGLHIGLISNTAMTPGVTLRRFLAQHGILQYFEVLTFSDEVKLAKPSPEIFLLTLRALGATPAQAIHVGDQLTHDVAGAKRCGLKAVWIEGDYERVVISDPDREPDVTVTELGLVLSAITKLVRRGPAV